MRRMPEGIEEAEDLRAFKSEVLFMAYLVEQGGEIYLPILLRMQSEYDAAVRRCFEREAPRDYARRLIDSYTQDGGLKAIR